MADCLHNIYLVRNNAMALPESSEKAAAVGGCETFMRGSAKGDLQFPLLASLQPAAKLESMHSCCMQPQGGKQQN